MLVVDPGRPGASVCADGRSVFALLAAQCGSVQACGQFPLPARPPVDLAQPVPEPGTALL
jgi:hypothetical protein